ncbi:MAG: EVE domain-containing protein [Candidatus Dadabacteria bacterium]|nr:EVE domain-containing protein [Candidatus Dadabacteria bacterium]
MNYWLVKSEPFKYSWEEFLQDGWTYWDGVRNYQARNNLKGMKKGDQVLFYHSNKGLEVVGISEVIREYYQDPTTEDDRWVVVDLRPVETLETPVSLSQIKNDGMLIDIALVKQSRLSVIRLEKKHFDTIVELGRKNA